MYHHDRGPSLPSDTQGYQQNCGGGLIFSMAPGSDSGALVAVCLGSAALVAAYGVLAIW
jgi:hypothetical protein